MLRVEKRRLTVEMQRAHKAPRPATPQSLGSEGPKVLLQNGHKSVAVSAQISCLVCSMVFSSTPHHTG
jgi:hypothetical protein